MISDEERGESYGYNGLHILFSVHAYISFVMWGLLESKVKK